MTDLTPLADLIAKLQAPNPMVCQFDVSPSAALRFRSVARPAKTVDLYGIRVVENPMLLDHMALLRFADGRLGYWDMRTDVVRLIPTIKDLLKDTSP